MAAKGLTTIEEQLSDHDYGFSVSVGNIIECSGAGFGSPSSSTEKQLGSPETLPVTIKNVKREKTGQSSKTIRKKISSETRTVKTTNLAGDGYAWRKYGQKIIHNQQYPKSYYRCTHYKEEKCEAKKWIQQESENPPIYRTTYLGHHTCKTPQIFFSNYSSLSSPTPSHDILESFENNRSLSPQSFLLRFNSPESSHFVSHLEKTQQETEEMGLNRDMSAPIETFDSTVFPASEASGIDMYGNENNGYFPSISSPNCNFGSFDFDMMMQEYCLLDLDNVNLMDD